MQKSFLERPADARIDEDCEESLPIDTSTCVGKPATEDLGIRRVLSAAHRQHRDIPSVWRLVPPRSSDGSNGTQDSSEMRDPPANVHEVAAGVDESDAETLESAATVVWPRRKVDGTTDSRSFMRWKGVGDPMSPSQRLMSWQAQIAMEQALHPRDRFSVLWRHHADMFSNGSRPPIVTWCKK